MLLYQSFDGGVTWGSGPIAEQSWLWDRTFDKATSVPFLGNYWRAYDTRKRSFEWFYPQTAGTFRVAVSYFWYATKRVPAHEEIYWVGQHFGVFGNPTHQWCVFPP
jgi:hypothetical protein